MTANNDVPNGRGSSGRGPIRMEVRAIYSVGELARAANVPAYRLLRLLRRGGITLLRMGRAFYVPLAEIRQKIPPLWQSICDSKQLQESGRGEKREPRVRAPRSPRSPRALRP